MWSPQPGPQAEAIAATWCPELLFGGARGGGKSEYLLADYLQDVPTYGKYWQGVLFRRTYRELEELIKRSADIYQITGATWAESAKEWRWANGARLRMRYLEHVRDASRYQGHEYTWIGWDEKTQWPSLEAYHRLAACLRCSAAEIKTKRIRASANPGGPGHLAIKDYFIDPAPMGMTPIRSDTGTMRMFIRSLVTDNKVLLASDPEYIDRLKRVGSPELVRMWLEGDWNVVAGAYFPEFGARQIVRPFEMPAHWTIRFRSLDWGSARPFSVGWWVVVEDDFTAEIAGERKTLPRGAIVRYREWYGASAANVGLKLTVEQVAQGIRRKEGDEKITYSVADPSVFSEDGGPSFAERFRREGVLFRRADNSRQAGWDQMRARLIGHDDRPMIYCFSTCTDSIRTVPALMHDEKKPEDLDSEMEDHAADDWRYACMSRPYTRPTKPPAPIEKYMNNVTLDELWKLKEQGNRERERF